jgi:PAS domain S-box-containing protein
MRGRDLSSGGCGDVTDKHHHLVDGKHSFKNMVEISRLEAIFKRFSQATGFTIGLISYPDQETLISTGLGDVCSRFHRVNPRSLPDCQRNCLERTSHLTADVEMTIHHCRTGMIDGVVPIVIEGAHLANLMTGQVLFEEPDPQRFARQAADYGFDVDSYLAAIGRVPVVTEDDFRSALQLFSDMALLLAELGLANLKTRESVLAARESEAKYRDLVESSSDWIWEVDGQGIYTYASPQVEDILGYTPDEVVGKTPFDFMPATEASRVKTAFQDLIGRGLPIVAMENTNRHRDGRKVVLETSGVPIIDGSGATTGYRGVDRDITERKLATEGMQTIQRLESVGILAGGIAHDFNNILMGVYGNLSIAKSRISEDHPAFGSIREAEYSLARATGLTQQLLTFSKGGAPVFEHANIAELVREVTRFNLSGSNVDSIFLIDEGLWNINVDKGQIHQAFSNLIINSIQAMPNGGKIFISISNFSVDTAITNSLKAGKYIKITIADEGTGIDPDHIDRIFDPYFSTKEKGSGLGLATTYSIIRNHGGVIAVESTQEIGTIFSVYLPASDLRKEVNVEDDISDKITPANDLGVLVMDDDEVVLDVVCQMLQNIGFKTEAANDGKVAIEKYRKAMNSGSPFGVVIMDLTVPGGLGGKETIVEILKIDPNAKAIVSSGFSDDTVIAKFADYGFKGIAIKPYTMAKLQEVINRVLREE